MHPSSSVLITNAVILTALSLWFVVSSVGARRRDALPGHFLGASGTLRIGSGTISLLGFWITGNTLMAAPESSYNLGVLGSIGYALIGSVALIAFAPLAVRIKRVVPHGRTIGDFFIHRFGRASFHLLLVVQMVYSFGVLVTQGVAGEVALHDILGVPHVLGLGVLLLVTAVYTAIGGFSSIVRVNFTQVFIILTVILVVPASILLKVGIHDVYTGILHHRPDFLQLSSRTGLEFIYSGIIMGIGEVFMDNAFWQRTFAMRRNSVGQSFALGGLVWMMVPLAISTLAFVAVAQGITTPLAGSIAPTVALAVGGWFAGSLILLGVWAAVTSTIGGFLNSIVAVILHDIYYRFNPNGNEHSQRRIGRAITLFIAALVFLVCLWKPFSLIGTLAFLGVLNAAFIMPIVLGLFTGRLQGSGTFLAAFSAIFIGYVVYFKVNPSIGILVSFTVSLFVCLLQMWLSPARFDWNELR